MTIAQWLFTLAGWVSGTNVVVEVGDDELVRTMSDRAFLALFATINVIIACGFVWVVWPYLS